MPGVMRTPRTVEIDITNRCNLRCLYCSHFTSAGDVEEDLPTGEWLRFFDELRECAVMEVVLQGGEAFYREDFIELIDGIVRNRMRFSILSNGTLITDDHAAFLAKTRRCNHVQVSIDGSCARVHDSCRGAGTFEKAVNAVSVLRSHSIPVSVRVTIHRHNVRDLENIAAFLLDELKLPSFSTNSASYLGLCRDHTDDISLTPGDRFLAMQTLLSLSERYNGRIEAQAGPLAEVRLWRRMLAQGKKTGAEYSGSGEGYLTSCGGVFSKIAVRADGVFVPCTVLPQIELGRINRDSLAEVWQKHPELCRLRERDQVSLKEFSRCRECTFISSCRGGCPGLAATHTGNTRHPSPDSCLLDYLENGGKVPGYEKSGA